MKPNLTESQLAILYPSRYCPACEHTKPRKDWNKKKATKDGLQVYCRLCQSKDKVQERKSAKAEKDVERKCLSCLKMFSSPYPVTENRICGKCSIRDTYSEADFNLQDMGGVE